ncbi:very short patch repair endonuclease [Demequina aestuarii]|nr:very short patch repair endonuclease [Demequina aestuarii]
MALRQAGWTVLRYWEHEDPAVVATNIVEVVRSRRAQANDGS